MEKKLRMREQLGQTIHNCFQKRATVVLEHQDIFQQPVEDAVGQRFWMGTGQLGVRCTIQPTRKLPPVTDEVDAQVEAESLSLLGIV